ncbi:hypothetical protein [Kribbella sp. NPDC051137]|uniref:hypothetical protein n=1 Tax=Kribbella sp. NPDC051137 TaxID=3155045 RepID=UPI002F4ABC55
MLLAVSELPHAVRSGGVLRVVGIVITTVAVVSVGVDCWHLLTRRPVLTVDGSGVRLGRRRFVAWSEIESIAELDGPTSDHTFVVVPNVRKRRLRVGHDHVRNVPAFRFWLGDLLDEHRA